ncbi:MAG: hypothetical protein HYZ85_04010 [Candidatus Omnitrophica bacterium]|nr:hypothetical protein [Candidatus Omnitrophota bacterium]
MKRFWVNFLALWVVMSSLSACIRTERVRAIEGSEGVLPYQSLGTLEIKQKAPYVTPGGILFTGIEVATLTFAKTPSRGDHYKRTLRAELAEVASKSYGADKVVNVEYWPDPDSGSFPDGYVYARGEMVRYHRFPKASVEEPEVIEEPPMEISDADFPQEPLGEQDQQIKRMEPVEGNALSAGVSGGN